MNLLMLLGHHRPYPLPSGKYIRSIEPFSEEDRQQKRILNTERRIECLRELIQDIGPITQGDAYPVLGMTWTSTVLESKDAAFDYLLKHYGIEDEAK